MNNAPLHARLSADQYAAVFDAARQRAIEARREASIAFWDAVIALVRRGWQALRRAPVADAAAPLSERGQRRHVYPAASCL